MTPVLYSFRRCPFAIRARMAIAVAGVEVALREVILRDKPVEMLAVSPKGTVPVLEIGPGEVLHESLEIMVWALESNDPANWLGASQEGGSDSHALVNHCDGEFKHWLDHYKYADRHPQNNPDWYRQQGESFLQILEQRLRDNRNLFGEDIRFADIAIFPFVRQFAHVDKPWFERSQYHKLNAWYQRIHNSSLFQSTMYKFPAWKAGDPTVKFPDPKT